MLKAFELVSGNRFDDVTASASHGLNPPEASGGVQLRPPTHGNVWEEMKDRDDVYVTQILQESPETETGRLNPAETESPEESSNRQEISLKSD